MTSSEGIGTAMSMSEELSAKECKRLKYNPEKKKLNYLRDGKSLYLEVLPNGPVSYTHLTLPTICSV